MSIGDKSISAQPERWFDGQYCQGTDGMSYREWLIGQALAGCCSRAGYDYQDASQDAINYADAAIARLNSESRP